jgi:hypothetical protein
MKSEDQMATNYAKYVGGKYLAADGDGWQVWILDIDEEREDYIVVYLNKDGRVSERDGLQRLDCFKATYRYCLEARSGG